MMRRRWTAVFAAAVACCALVFGLSACGSSASSSSAGSASVSAAATSSSTTSKSIAEPIHDISSELTFDHDLELSYADQFAVSYYKDGYKAVALADGERFLVVPEGGKTPGDLAKDVQVLEQPLDHIYLVGTATMDMFRSIDGLDSISLSGTEADDWDIEEAKAAMEAGKIVYAGKYNTPDYELILSKDCDLAVESTMINHNPEVKEQLQSYGIPVLIDQSSYESEPLGRSEWVKLYGALLNKDEEAQKVCDEQQAILDSIHPDQVESKEVAFFAVANQGYATVRKSNDYVAKMIGMAGGTYVPSDGDEDASAMRTTYKMQMEEFYAQCKDSDYLIYNSTIEGELGSMSDLKAKNELFGEFKAVQDGNVWCTSQSMYQDSMELAQFMQDVNKILQDPSTPDSDLNYLHKLK